MTFFNRKLSDCSEINHLVENGKLIEFLRWIADHFDSFEIRTIENILPIVEKLFEENPMIIIIRLFNSRRLFLFLNHRSFDWKNKKKKIRWESFDLLLQNVIIYSQRSPISNKKKFDEFKIACNNLFTNLSKSKDIKEIERIWTNLKHKFPQDNALKNIWEIIFWTGKYWWWYPYCYHQ